MIQPLSMTTNAIVPKVSFSPKKNYTSVAQESPNYSNVGPNGLKPSVANSKLGQKLDFYA